MQAREERKDQGLGDVDLVRLHHHRLVCQRHLVRHRRGQGGLQQSSQFAVRRRHRRRRDRRALREAPVRKRRQDRTGLPQSARRAHPAEQRPRLDVRRELVSRIVGFASPSTRFAKSSKTRGARPLPGSPSTGRASGACSSSSERYGHAGSIPSSRRARAGRGRRRPWLADRRPGAVSDARCRRTPCSTPTSCSASISGSTRPTGKS